MNLGDVITCAEFVDIRRELGYVICWSYSLEFVSTFTALSALCIFFAYNVALELARNPFPV